MLDKGYGIMPNIVLFDTKISSTAKIVFCLISSLTAQEGYCWATNSYIGEKLGLKPRQVIYCLRQLDKYISCTMVTSEKRQIKLIPNPCIKMHTPMQKMTRGGAKKCIHNIITNNTKEKTVSSKDYMEKFYPKRNMPDLGGY